MEHLTQYLLWKVINVLRRRVTSGKGGKETSPDQ